MPGSEKSRYLVPLSWAALVLAGLAAYHNSFSGPFVLDDVEAISGNPTIRHLASVVTIVRPPHGGFTVSGRPILNLSFALNYALGGLDVRGYHAVNLAIHILAGLTLFGIARRTRGLTLATAFAVALLWIVHPLQTESVTYVVQRAESLMGLFYLLTIYCFVRWVGGGMDAGVLMSQERTEAILNQMRAEAMMGKSRTGPPSCVPLGGTSEGAPTSVPPCGTNEGGGGGRAAWSGLCVLCCLFGMATKEVMVSAPVIVFLYDRTFVSGCFKDAWRRHRALYAGLALTWIPLVCLVIGNGSRGGTTGFATQVPWWRYYLTQFPAVTTYLRLSFLPFPLIFDRGAQWLFVPLSRIPSFVLIVFALVVIVLVAGTVRALRRAPVLGFCGVFFLAILAPTSLVPGARQTLAEHRMYLALAPFLAVVVCGADATLAQLGARRWVRGAVLAVAAGALLVTTIRRNEVYRTDLGLWRDTLARLPRNSFAQANLGVSLLEAGRTAEADARLEEALRIDPYNPQVNYDYALLRAREGRVEEAMRHYETAIAAKPDLADARNNLGILLKNAGRIPEAIAQYEEALRTNPNHVEAHIDLGIALADSGRLDEAIAQYGEALRLNPQSAEALCNLGNALRQSGRIQDAMARYQESIRSNPAYAEAHNDMGVALAQVERLPEAIRQFQRAIDLKPSFFEAHVNLGSALKDSGRPSAAAVQLAAAAALHPGDPAVQNALGAVLFQLNRWTEAIAAYEEAVRLRPDYPQALCNLGVALATTGRLPEAVSRLSEAVRLNPNYAEGHSNLAVVLAQSGRLADAIGHYERALQLRPDEPRIHSNLAAVLEAVGRPAEARLHREAAARLEAR